MDIPRPRKFKLGGDNRTIWLLIMNKTLVLIALVFAFAGCTFGQPIMHNIMTTNSTPVALTIISNSAAGAASNAVYGTLGYVSGNLTGNGNFFLSFSGNTTLSGSDNFGFGGFSLHSITSGSFNIGLGDTTLGSDSSGSQNIAIGHAALSSDNGNNNVAIGVSALPNKTSGDENIAIGHLSGLQIITGSSNIDIGNFGVATDTNIIRIGSGQSDTYLAGSVHGNLAALPILALAHRHSEKWKSHLTHARKH